MKTDIDVIRDAVHKVMPEIPVVPERSAENLAELIERLGEERALYRKNLQSEREILGKLREAVRLLLDA